MTKKTKENKIKDAVPWEKERQHLETTCTAKAEEQHTDKGETDRKARRETKEEPHIMTASDGKL